MKNENLIKPRGTLQFPIKGNSEEMKNLIKAEEYLRKAGVKFDTGYCSTGIREWELDWSLKGAKLVRVRETDNEIWNEKEGKYEYK